MHIRSTFYSAVAIAVLAGVMGAQAPVSKTTYVGDVGFVSASGNTQLATLNVDDKIVHTDARWTFSQIGAYVFGETKQVSTANQLRLALRADYTLHPRLSLFAGTS